MPYNPAGGGALNPDWPNKTAQITGFSTLTGNVAAMKQHIQNAIETWRVHGSQAVNLRMWVSSLVRGLWSNESADNAHVYLDKLGWSRLAYGTPGANQSMLTELTSSRLRGTAVSAFHDSGQIIETYV